LLLLRRARLEFGWEMELFRQGGNCNLSYEKSYPTFAPRNERNFDRRASFGAEPHFSRNEIQNTWPRHVDLTFLPKNM